MTDHSLVPYNMYEDKVRILEFHRDRCSTDLNQFLKSFFGRRDKYLGKPGSYRRWNTKGNKTRYYFTFGEMIEAFIGRYTPEQLAGLLESHLTDETLQSEALCSRIRNCVDEHRIAFLTSSFSPRGIAAYNFPVGDLENAILSKELKWKSFFSPTLFKGGYHCNYRGLNSNGKNYPAIFTLKLSAHLQKVKDRLNKCDPPILLICLGSGV